MNDVYCMTCNCEPCLCPEPRGACENCGEVYYEGEALPLLCNDCEEPLVLVESFGAAGLDKREDFHADG